MACGSGPGHPRRRLQQPRRGLHRRISLLHAQGKSWAQIAELVGNRSAKLLSDTYTHVLMDERELDYEALIAELLNVQSTTVVLA